MFLQSVAGADPIVVEGLFSVTPERMFRAWTTPEEIIKWFGRAPNSLVAAEIDLRVGGRWRFVLERSEERTRQVEGEYLEIEENRKLVFSWTFVTIAADGEAETSHASRVTVTFTADGKATRVDLTHEAIREEDSRMGVGQGWQFSFTSLQALFEQNT